MTTESTLRAALQSLINVCEFIGADRSAVVKDEIAAAKSALSAHPARASQEPNQSFEEFWKANGEDAPLWDRKPWSRRVWNAAVAADRAARPESVDARRYRWLRERYTVLCRMECARALGLDLSRVFVNTVEKFDAIVDAAIAKGAES